MVAVLTAADLPFVDGAAGRAGQPLARSEIVYSGQPVALVVAETEAAAADGVDQVVVDVEPLEAALDIESAMAPGAALARVEVVEGDGADSAARTPRRAAATLAPTRRSSRTTSRGASR